jgi:hypothetical protein
MRPILAAACALVLPASALAQSLPRIAAVTAPDVILRAGPSDRYPDTGTLSRGTQLIVYEEAEGGWLAVHAPGSVSWVPMTFINFDKTKPIPQNVKTQAEVALASGKVGLAQPLAEVRLAKMPAGTALLVIGPSVTFDNKTWYPVEPILGDYRYLPRTAVEFQEPVKTAFVVRDTPPEGTSVADAPGSPKTPAAHGSPAANHPLWAQAEAAERDGRIEEAEKLYFQLARVMNEPGGDHDIANLCYTRIHMIREKKRGGNGMAGTRSTSGTGSRGVIPASSPVARTADDSRDSRATLLPPVPIGRDREQPRVRPIAEPAPRTAEPGDGGPRWTGPGTLQRAALALDGRQTYVLESAPGVPVVYAVGAPGVDLKPYWKRKVDLYGTVHDHPNARRPYVLVTKVEPNP